MGFVIVVAAVIAAALVMLCFSGDGGVGRAAGIYRSQFPVAQMPKSVSDGDSPQPGANQQTK